MRTITGAKNVLQCAEAMGKGQDTLAGLVVTSGSKDKCTHRMGPDARVLMMLGSARQSRVTLSGVCGTGNYHLWAIKVQTGTYRIDRV